MAYWPGMAALVAVAEQASEPDLTASAPKVSVLPTAWAAFWRDATESFRLVCAESLASAAVCRLLMVFRTWLSLVCSLSSRSDRGRPDRAREETDARV